MSRVVSVEAQASLIRSELTQQHRIRTRRAREQNSEAFTRTSERIRIFEAILKNLTDRGHPVVIQN